MSDQDHTSDAIAANRARWDEVVDLHIASDFYRVDAFRRGEEKLDPIVLAEVGDVAGLKLLHLQCHFGLDTLSFARLGADATGLDFSPKAIAAARALAAETGLDARFVEGRVEEAPELAGRDFDVVFTSWGVLMWLPDLAAWAKAIINCLKPGGRFYIAEGHPIMWAFEDTHERYADNLRVVRSYFLDGAQHWDSPVDYADPTYSLKHHVAHEWQHGLGEVVTALAGVGLRIEFLHEHDRLPWPGIPGMMRKDRHFFEAPADEPRLPVAYSISARKLP
jgi:SAM-dependent methyltransferase